MRVMQLISKASDYSMACKRKLRLTMQFAVGRAGIPERSLFLKWVNASLERSAEVVLRIVDMEEGEALNRSFRGKHAATNVLTFVYDEGKSLAGDIVLCAPVIHKEAQQQQKCLIAHYAHLTVHGILHLQGYDHINDEEAAIMESLETKIVTQLGYADPYLTQ
jgi:probable rRNA maturation factor